MHHPQLLTQDAWATLLARFEVTMRSTTRRAIRGLRKTHKDFLQEAGITWGHQSPQIARPESSLDDPATHKHKPVNVDIPPSFIHYQLSCLLSLQVDGLHARSEAADATAVGASCPDAAGARSPGESKQAPQPMIDRKKKQTQRAFLDMCRSTLHRVPYCAFEEHASTLEI